MKINLPVNQRECSYDDDVEIISTTNMKGIIQSANRDFMDVSGFDDEEIIGKNHNTVRHPDMPPEAFADLWATIKAGRPWIGIVKNRCKNGDHYWVDAYVSPMYIDGKIAGYQSVRVKPEREVVNRADRLYKKIIGAKSEDEKRRSKLAEIKLQRLPIGICSKLTIAMFFVLAPLLAILGFFSDISIPLLIATLPLATGAAYAVIRYTMKPLLRIAEESKSIAHNPLAQYVYTGLHDEAGQLGFAMKFTQAKLRTAIGRVKESSEVLNRAANEIASGSMDLSQRTEEQASSLEETASSMEQMTSTVKQNADNARQANQLAAGARDQAEQGGAVVSKAVSAVSEINVASKKIADIIGVIDEIAFQTNLLALNAAVEAARAGEQGRGFAVVAGEVRTLAGRSAEAAKQIKDLITDSVEKVEQGAKLVEDSGQTLGEIVTSVKKVTDIMSEIAAASQEQASGVEQVNKAVMQMDEMTQQNAALVEESAAASGAMVDKVGVLSGLALQFKLEDN